MLKFNVKDQTSINSFSLTNGISLNLIEINLWEFVTENAFT